LTCLESSRVESSRVESSRVELSWSQQSDDVPQSDDHTLLHLHARPNTVADPNIPRDHGYAQSRAEQSCIEQSRAELHRTEQSSAAQSSAELHRAEQCRAVQCSAELHRTEHCCAEQCRSGQSSAVQIRAKQSRAVKRCRPYVARFLTIQYAASQVLRDIFQEYDGRTGLRSIIHLSPRVSYIAEWKETEAL
jgi:hypothetical protein